MTTSHSIPLLAAGSFLGLLHVSAGAAQEHEPIATDRPGLSFSPITVPRGAFQIEAGLPQVELVDTGEADARTIRIPTFALRVGVTERIELRASTALYNDAEVETDEGDITESGGGDLEAGFKLHVLESTSSRPDISLVGSFVLPIGDHAFTIHEDRLGYGAFGVFGWPLEQVGITAVTGATWAPLDDDQYTTSGSFVLLLGRSLAERTSGYVEAGAFPREDADGTPVLAGAGIAYLLTPALQIDAFFDAGLTDEATDWTFGTGISTRLP